MSTENIITNRQSLLTRLLKTTGRFYITLIIVIAQQPLLPRAAFGILKTDKRTIGFFGAGNSRRHPG
jgi:hypothetical protein